MGTAGDGAVVSGNGPGNTLMFAQLWNKDGDTGVITPDNVGTTGNRPGDPAAPTNIVAVVTNAAGQVVTMFPASPTYVANQGATLTPP